MNGQETTNAQNSNQRKNGGAWHDYYIATGYLCGNCGMTKGSPLAPEFKGRSCTCKQSVALQ